MKLTLLDKTILYVEDDLNSQEEMVFFLKSIVKNVLVANNGENGLELFLKNKCDLIITDIQMPVMNGLEMINQIRKYNENIPITILTAFNESKYLLDALNAGVSTYLFKPIKLKELKDTIIKHLFINENSILKHFLDEEGKIISVNNEWLSYFKYKEEEVIGKLFSDFIDESFLSSYNKNFSLLVEHKLENFYLQIIDKEGIRKEIILNCVRQIDKNNNFISNECELKSINYFFKSVQNITNRLEKEQYINEVIKIQTTIAKEITSHPNSLEFYKKICKAFSTSMKYQHTFIIKKESNTWELIANSNHNGFDSKTFFNKNFFSLDSNICITSQVLNNQSIVVIDNIQEIESFYKKSLLIDLSIHSMVAIPINKDLSNIDTILILMQSNIHKFTKEEIDLFHNISDTILLGLETIKYKEEKEELLKELHKKATTDFLTKSLNRQEGVNIIHQEINRKKRYHQDLSIIFFDIDYFKKINDQYGHDKGDEILIEVCQAVKKVIRVTDFLIRWGGEEFIIILPETNQERSIISTKKIQEELEKIHIEDLKITASFGITQFKYNDSFEEFLNRADLLMYKAKTTGRNQFKVG